MNSIQASSFDKVKMWKLGSNFFGRPKMYVYSFLIDGLLIDTGQPRVRKEFLTLLGPEKVSKIILTHHHEDHSGNVEAIKTAKSVSAFGSKLCCEKMKNPQRVEPARWITWGQHTPCDLAPLTDKQIATDHYNFEILSTPGHAADQISLYEPNKGWLFSGDIYVNDYIKIFMREEVMLDQIKSLKELISLDFDVLFCNHQPIFKNGKDRLIAKLNFLSDFYAKVEMASNKGLEIHEIMKYMNLKDDPLTSLMTFGQLSQSNMIRAALKTIQTG